LGVLADHPHRPVAAGSAAKGREENSMSARADLEALAAQLGGNHRVEHDDDCLWVVRTNSEGAAIPVAFMPPLGGLRGRGTDDVHHQDLCDA
jgi:hypothetical protein